MTEKRRSTSLRLPTALHEKLVTLATTKACTMTRLLTDLLDLAEIAAACERIEVTFPRLHEGRPVVKVWLPETKDDQG